MAQFCNFAQDLLDRTVVTKSPKQPVCTYLSFSVSIKYHRSHRSPCKGVGYGDDPVFSIIDKFPSVNPTIPNSIKPFNASLARVDR